MTRMTELEGVCLGLIRKHQPCTAYRVRQLLKASPSSHWRASAGSVYPLVRRFESSGLVMVVNDKSDGRGRRTLATTAQGREALKGWLCQGADAELVATVMDPVRTRMFFLSELPHSQQLRLLDDMIAEAQRHAGIANVQLQELMGQQDLYGELGSLGAVSAANARLEWLGSVRERIKKAS